MGTQGRSPGRGDWPSPGERYQGRAGQDMEGFPARAARAPRRVEGPKVAPAVVGSWVGPARDPGWAVLTLTGFVFAFCTAVSM